MKTKLVGLLIGAALMLATGSAMALPTPAPNFTMGGITFSNFAAFLNAGTNTTPVDLAFITTTPVILAGNPGFQISGGFSAAGFGGPTSIDLLLTYQATSSIGLLHDVELSFNGNSIVKPSFASITESAYSDAGHLNLLGVATVATPSPLSTQIIFSQDVSTVYITKDIQLDAFLTNGFVTLSDIDQTFSTAAPVPEPGTVMLLATGFLGLAFYGKRGKIA